MEAHHFAVFLLAHKHVLEARRVVVHLAERTSERTKRALFSRMGVRGGGRRGRRRRVDSPRAPKKRRARWFSTSPTAVLMDLSPVEAEPQVVQKGFESGVRRWREAFGNKVVVAVLHRRRPQAAVQKHVFFLLLRCRYLSHPINERTEPRVSRVGARRVNRVRTCACRKCLTSVRPKTRAHVSMLPQTTNHTDMHTRAFTLDLSTRAVPDLFRNARLELVVVQKGNESGPFWPLQHVL